jgi:hypothetical protein
VLSSASKIENIIKKTKRLIGRKWDIWSLIAEPRESMKDVKMGLTSADLNFFYKDKQNLFERELSYLMKVKKPKAKKQK